MTPTEARQRPLSLFVKIIYGTGDWALASFGTIRTLLLGIFLTDVVGLAPQYAAIAILIGVLWDAVNDPLIGAWSDHGYLIKRLVARWGRRRPFLLMFAIPYGLSFLAMWVAPTWTSQWALLIHVTFVYALSDTMFTLVSVPYFSLTPELTPDYDERTTLTTFRMLFNLAASLVTAVVAPEIVKSAPTLREGYQNVALIFGGLAMIPFLAIFWVTGGIKTADAPDAPPLIESFKAAWANIPFRHATGIYLLNWVAVDLVALVLPYFIVYWLEGGVQNSQIAIPGLGKLTIESILFGIFLGTAALAVPLWWFVSRRLQKHTAYILGLSFWLVAQLLFLTIAPGQRTYAFILAFVAGIGVSTAHVLPDSLFPDVMEWDELVTGQRREGIYYGVRTFVRKVTTAGALALALQVLGATGYRQPPAGSTVFAQNETALWAIRVLVGPAGAALVLAAIVLAFFYPLTRERHSRVRRLLEKRRERVEAEALAR